jgi:exodeoxyribonuclease VII large subunit
VDRIGQLRSRPVLAGHDWIVDTRAQELTRQVARGAELVERALEKAQTHTRELAARLRTLSPQSTLDRGYAIVQVPGGHVARVSTDAPAETPLVITLADGTIGAVSTGTHGADRPDDR